MLSSPWLISNFLLLPIIPRRLGGTTHSSLYRTSYNHPRSAPTRQHSFLVFGTGTLVAFSSTLLELPTCQSHILYLVTTQSLLLSNLICAFQYPTF